MKMVFNGKKAQVTDDVKRYAEKKIGKLDRFFRGESEAFVTFDYERGRYEAEVTVRNNGMYFRVSEKTGDMYASIDSAVGAIEGQIRKNKTRLAKRLREGLADVEFETPEVKNAVDEEEPDFEIVRTKKFAIKPMTVEEAILQMNLLEHEFFFFRNQDEDDSFSVVYKRKNGGYGLIESDDV